MTAAGADKPHNSMKSHTRLRRLLLTAVAILGVGFVFVTTSPVVVHRFTRQQAGPELATAALRSVSVLASASGVLQFRNGATFVLWAAFSKTEDVLLAPRQSATVTVDAIPGLTLPAKVSLIEPRAAPVGGVPEYYAEIEIDQFDSRLRSGQTGSVNVTIASANNVLSVPRTALFRGGNNATEVDVWSGGRAYATAVIIGLVGNSLSQITSGLDAGEQVLLSPAMQSSGPTSSSPT
jgi:macrolide-specific efflux system membrane fusion protein